MYRRFVVSEGAVVEFTVVVGETVSAGEEMSVSFGIRERNGTRNWYPVASTSESTSSREVPSVNTAESLVKCDIGGFTVTCASSGGAVSS